MPIVRLIPYIQGDKDVSRPEVTILVAWNDKGDCSISGKVPGMPASEGRTSEDSWTSSTSANSGMEVGAHHYGLRHCLTSQPERKQYSMGHSGSSHEVSALIPFRLGLSTELLAESTCRR